MCTRTFDTVIVTSPSRLRCTLLGKIVIDKREIRCCIFLMTFIFLSLAGIDYRSIDNVSEYISRYVLVPMILGHTL